MNLRYFAHSWLSDWNHGNAHFLRGLASALVRRGHQVRCYEDAGVGRGGWSLEHLWSEPDGAAAVQQMRAAYPELNLRLYWSGEVGRAYPRLAATGVAWVTDWASELREAEVVVVHEWNPPALFERLLYWRDRYGFRLLLHDTHHRALSQPEAIERFPLARLDAVVAFGESLRRVYEACGVRRTYTLHEAADTARFPAAGPRLAPFDPHLVWVGNWGDDERGGELDEFLLRPVQRLGVSAVARGVRYPAAARAAMAAHGVRHGGYLANLEVPRFYAQAGVAVHIPRRPYARALAGIPTIRVFETLACGMPLVCAPWRDTEGLFTSGEDYWVAENEAMMVARVMQLLADQTQRNRLGGHGAATVRARHTCALRAQELEAICHDLD